MAQNEEYGTKVRLLRIMRAILERPYGYTKRQLADQYGCDKSTVKRDLQAIQNAGFGIRYDNQWRYAFVEDKASKELQHLLHFSEEEQLLLEEAIESLSSDNSLNKRLKRKLGSLYDYQQLGFSYLRKPHLAKIDLLEKALKEKQQVILMDYPSGNSNAIRDRLVEAFHISPADDMIHAWDIEKEALRHFRISRIKRVKLGSAPWANTALHAVLPTDPFRIVSPKQVNVHLRMSVGARNELLERYPLTKGYVEPANEEDTFDLQCKVNARFLGLTNFILANYHFQIEVLTPEGLITHLNKTIGQMTF